MIKRKITKFWDLFFSSKLRKSNRRRKANHLRFEPLEQRHMLTVVTGFTPTDTGFVVQFDQAIDPASVIVNTSSSPPSNVTLNGLNTGDIQGSALLSSDLTQLTFVADNGALAPDTYTASLFDSLYDAQGETLDGDSDGLPGGAFIDSFTITGEGGGESGGDGGSNGGGNAAPTPEVADTDFDAFDHSAKMTITLDAISDADVTFNFKTVDGTATSNPIAGLSKDYDHVEGSITIPAGQQTATISITIHADIRFRDPRSFSLQLLDPTTGQKVAEGIATIHDVKFSITPLTEVSESDGFLTLYVTPSNPTYEVAATVDFRDRAGTAKRTTDYEATSGVLRWEVGDAEAKTIRVAITDDSIFELTEEFFIDLENPKYDDPAGTPVFTDDVNGSGKVKIQDDDAMPMATITPAASAMEGNAMMFTVSLSSASDVQVSVEYTTADNSALAGVNYLSASGILVFEPGETEQTISITTLDDNAALGDISFFVNLLQASYAEIDAYASSGTGVVLDNPPPTAIDDDYSVQQGQSISIAAGAGLLINDTDAANAALSAILETGPSHGTLTLGSDGSFTYVADASYMGTDSFTYRANNGSHDSNLATVSIYVYAPPVLQDQSYEVSQDHVLEVIATGLLAGATDANGYGVSVVAESGNSYFGGIYVLNTDGSFSYMPATGFVGTDSFTYSASNGLASSTAQVSITVSAISAPSATDHAYGMNQYESLNACDLLDGAADPNGYSLSVVAASGSTGNGSFTINVDGSFNYTPNSNFSGVDSFSFVVTNGWASSTATATIDVQALPTPIAVDQSFEVLACNTLTGTLQGTGDGLWIIADSGSIYNGSYSVNPDGSFSFNPAAVGLASFSYTVTNGHDNSTANVSITVDSVPAPLAQGKSFTMNQYGVLNAGGLLDGASDPNGLSIWVVPEGVWSSSGWFNVGSDGSFSYTPNTYFSGTDTFSFEVTNGWASTWVSVSIMVLALPTPIASNQSYDIATNSGLTGTLPGAGDGLWIVADGGSTGNGSYSIAEDGSFSYTPNPDYVGSDSFGYAVTNGYDICWASISINVFMS